ncbi:hypothetical protein LTR85_001398 [Meristemomyces frigidus]|nr:hypothetical protein LTR85_001398 [Meristemomyces frigidus]
MDSFISRPQPAPSSPNARSPLLALPGELRNAIYEEAFRTFTAVEIVSGGHGKDEPGLLTVSRQVRDEALPIFLHNVFIIPGTITSRVHTFDFTDFIAFFTEAVKTEVVKHRLEQTQTRKYINLQLTLDDDWRVGKEGLNTWFRCVGGVEGPEDGKLLILQYPV